MSPRMNFHISYSLSLFFLMFSLSAFCQEVKQTTTKEVEGGIKADLPVYLSNDGRYLLTTADRHTGLILTDTTSGQSIVLSKEKGVGYYAFVTSDNRYVCYKSFWRTPESILQKSMLFDIQKGQGLALNEWSPLAGIPAVSPQGNIAFTTGDRLSIVDSALQPISDFNLRHHVNLLSFSADGQTLALNNRQDRIVLLDVASGSMRVVSAGDDSFFAPRFSPKGEHLLFSDVRGNLYCRDTSTEDEPIVVGRGSMARWIDANTICYVKKTIEKHEVVQTEILYVEKSGKQLNRVLLNSGDANAAVSRSGFVSNIKGQLNLGVTGKEELLPKKNLAVPMLSQAVQKSLGEIRTLVDKSTTREIGGVPVIHQVYDVSNWWWGHWSCGPTAALMCLQYYHTLPKHTFDCTHYSAHKSNYGFYISDIYSFNGYTYDVGAWVEPAAATAYGGHGWIWQDNGKHTSADMKDYINQHGPSSPDGSSFTWDVLQQEIMNGYPFVILSLITSGGHYQSVIGYFKNQHTLIVNDPYGDKNTSGYPSYDGQRCFYDWPGYSNGYENLNVVSIYIYCRDTIAASPAIYMTDIVVDNDDGPSAYSEVGTWATSGSTGYDGGTYRYAYGADAATAVWTGNVLYEGDYQVFAIYRQGTTRATSVRYKVTDSTGDHFVDIDQSGAAGMVETSLGTYHFNSGSCSVSVICADSTPVGNAVISDAIRFKLITSVEADNDDGAPAYGETGSWSTSSHKGHNGKTYRNIAVSSAAKATYTVNLQHTGKYEISTVNRAWNSYVTAAEYEINTPFGTELVYDDQTQDNLEWKSLGAFSFHEGENTIAVDAAGSSAGSWVQADAVRFTMSRIAFVADNDDGSPTYTESGPWTTSGNPGYLGLTYRWADGGADATAAWNVDLPVAGEYEVFALIREGGDRCANVKYTLDPATGDVDVSIDQGGSFAEISEVSLGTYIFSAGSHSVILDAQTGTPQTTNCVISDSVRFDLLTPYTIDGKQFSNALENGGFEEDFDHWGKLSSTSCNILTSGAHGGSKACEFYNASAYATVWQNPGEVNGETWRTTAWAYHGTGTTSPGFGFKDQNGNTEAGVSVDSTAWDFYSVDWTIADDIDAQCWGTAGSMFIDDVRCGKASRMNWITDWIWNGVHGSDLDTDYFSGDGGEANVLPGPGGTSGGKTWTSVSQPDGFVDLASQIGGGPTDCVAYAHVYVNANSAKSGIFLLVGSDDGIKVFLNGSLVHDNDTTRTHDYFSPDLDLVSIPVLDEGQNRLLLKIKNGSGPYSFSARFCDEYGDAVSGLTYSLEGEPREVGTWVLY